MPAKKIHNPSAYAAAIKRNAFAREFAKHVGFTKPVMKRQAARAGKFVAKTGKRIVTRAAERGLASMMSGGGEVTLHHGRGIHSKKYSGEMHSRSSNLHEKGEMIIRHSEYIGDLTVPNGSGSSTFSQISYPIQPGASTTFPWLSSTAQNFQMYKFKRLVFEFRPLASNAISSTTGSVIGMGSIVMATEYDSAQCYSSTQAYPNKQTMLESDFSSSCKPDEHMVHVVECEPKFNPLGILYTSSSLALNVGTNSSDIRMFNLGAFQIAACGVPNTSGLSVSLGEIWCHYEIEILKPQFNQDLSGILSAHYSLGTSISGTNYFGSYTGTNLVPQTNSSLPLQFGTSGTNMSFQFPSSINTGSYLVIINWTSSVPWTGGQPVPSIAPVGAGTILPVWKFQALTSVLEVNAPLGGTDNTEAQVLAFIVQLNQVNSQVVTITLTGATTFNGTVIGDLFITQYNYYITT